MLEFVIESVYNNSLNISINFNYFLNYSFVDVYKCVSLFEYY